MQGHGVRPNTQHVNSRRATMQLASAAAQRRAPVPLSVGTAQRATTCAAPGAPALRSGPRLSRLRASALMPQHNPWVTAHAAPRPAAAPRAPPPVAAPARQPTPHRRAPRRAVAAAAAAPLPSNPDACTAALAPRLRAAAAAAAAGIDQHFLPFCLTAGVVAGCLYPPAGVAAAKLNLSTLVTFAMFVIAGLQLRGEEAAKALQARGERAARGRARAAGAGWLRAARARARAGGRAGGARGLTATTPPTRRFTKSFGGVTQHTHHTPRRRPAVWPGVHPAGDAAHLAGRAAAAAAAARVGAGPGHILLHADSALERHHLHAGAGRGRATPKQPAFARQSGACTQE